MPPAPNALASAREATPATARESVLVVDLDPGSEEARSVSTLLEANATKAACETRYRSAREPLHRFAESWWVRRLLAGAAPGGPVKFRNPTTDETVSWVVQDRATSADLDPDAVAELGSLLGRRVAKEVVERTEYRFDPGILDAELPDGSGRVFDLVGEDLAKLLAKHVKAKRLTREQADALIVKRTRRSLAPGFLGRLPKLAGDEPTLVRALDLVGKAVLRFLRT